MAPHRTYSLSVQVRPTAVFDDADVPTTARNEEKAGETDRAPQVWPVVLALALVAAVWIVLFVVRVQAHQPNADDFLYARVARSIFESSNPFSTILTTGQTSPLVPALAAPLVAAWGVNGGIALELAFLLTLCLGAYTLARVWADTRTSLVVLLVVGLNAATLSYAVMFNFALASSAATVWCLATYLRSNRLHRRGWSVGFAFSLAALILSRSVAPVYVVPLVLLVVVDLGWGLVKCGQRIAMPLAAVCGIVLLVAGPWWLRSGSAVTNYLLHAGYQPSSGYTSSGLVLTPATLWNRVTWELFNLDWIGGVVLGVAVAGAVVAWWLRLRNRERLPGLWIVWVWTIVALLILASSGNLGTAFGLPLIIVVIVACGVVLGRAFTLHRHRMFIAVGAFGLVALTTASLFSSVQSPWWHSAPYRLDVVGAGGSQQTDVAGLASSIADTIRGERTVLGVDNPLLNANGVLWSARSNNNTGWLSAPSKAGPTAFAVDHLKTSKWLVTGSARLSFLPINDGPVAAAAVGQGFRPVRVWHLGPSANVVLWRKGAAASPLFGRAPAVTLVRPDNGSGVSGNVVLLCNAQDLLGVKSVDFTVAGGPGTSIHSVLRGGETLFGWLGFWPAQGVPPGRYTITCNATSVGGVTGHASHSVDLR